MSKKTIALEDLKVGMFVELPGGWLSHDFVRNEFMINSQTQLEKLRKHNIREVIVHLDRSEVQPASEELLQPVTSEVSREIPRPKVEPAVEKKVWDSEFIKTDDLNTILDDRKLEPQSKAKLTYDAAVTMMEHLLEFPNKGNIKKGKQAIYRIADMALNEPETANHMLYLTTHDYKTYSHSVNVGFYATVLAKTLYKNSDAHDLRELAAGFFLHDIGKTAIEPEVLNKAAKLQDIEWQHIKTHPYMGYKMLQEADALKDESRIIVLQHHENYNGTGYPNGLKARDIHEYARICSIADVYDALTTDRVYKNAIGSFDALRLMRDEMLLNFDAEIFKVFVQLFMR
jgi:HD-GYP domain-containing protein (c-di-GMP phosphodiesterase class II)